MWLPGWQGQGFEMSDRLTFIDSLKVFASEGGERLFDVVYDRTGYNECRGERILARGLEKYFSSLQNAMSAHFYYHLKLYLVDAFEEFRTHEKWVALRRAYATQTDHEVPDLLNVHVGGLHRLLAVNQLSYMCTVLSGKKWMRSALESYFHAQQYCIDASWGNFVRKGYRTLLPKIKEESHRGNKGQFGETTLMTYACAGRVMFTFQRGDASMTYVADDSDMVGVRSGANSTSTPYAECISMIDEVTRKWDIDLMVRDDKLGM